MSQALYQYFELCVCNGATINGATINGATFKITGLYAQVMKDYNTKMQAQKDSSEDEDSELQWCDNVAYGSREIDSIFLPNNDRQYNTAPHPSRIQRAAPKKKYATISATTGKPYNEYADNEYAEVGKVRPKLFQRPDGYEPGDSQSSLSSRSKDSLGSQGGDDFHFSSVKSRIDYFSGKGPDSPKNIYPASPRWRKDVKSQTLEEGEPKAPLAKQEV